jgi:hypothetical protein
MPAGARAAVRVIDADLGVSGASNTGRTRYGVLTAEVALGQVGIVLSLEVPDWRAQHRLVPAAGPGRHLRHADPRRRRPFTARRCSAAWAQRNMSRSRTARAARPPRRWVPYAGGGTADDRQHQPEAVARGTHDRVGSRRRRPRWPAGRVRSADTPLGLAAGSSSFPTTSRAVVRGPSRTVRASPRTVRCSG